MPETQDTVIAAFSHAFRYLLPDGTRLETEEAETQVLPESMSIHWKGGGISVAYRDIIAARAENYRVYISARNGMDAELYYLGHSFDSFCEAFFGAYNTIVKSDTFMGEESVCVKRGASYAHPSAHENGECDLLFGKHAITVQRVYGEPARLPFALIDSIDFRQYDFSVIVYGDRWDFSMLGHEYDGVKTQYSKCLSALKNETAEWLRQIKADIAGATLEKAAAAFLDGRAVERRAAENIMPGLWDAVFEKACEYGHAEAFRHLRDSTGEIYLGFKDSLMYSEGSYIWMMAQIGGSLIYEAVSSTDAAMATYVFRLAEGGMTLTAALVNYCMHMTEFRREPVYLTREELEKPENAGHLDALRRVPQLNQLRGLYQCRLIHSSHEKWLEALQKAVSIK